MTGKPVLNRRTLIKNFTIGFLPLLVFIIADSLFGLTAGLLIAIFFGIVETVVIYIREKRIDRFILADTGLIVLLGFISILLQNDIFFKVKPGLVEFILVLLLAVTAFSNNPILIKMSGRYLKNIELAPEQIQQMQLLMKKMFFVFTAHTILIFYSAFFMSKEVWAFISGGLFYILIGSLFMIEFVRTRFKQIRLKKQFEREEWFDIVTREGKIIGKAPRSQFHGNPELIHPVVHVHIINSKGEIFLQKRSPDKQIQPGKWDAAIGGHVASGETIDHALHREAEEELGISLGKFQPLFRYVMRNDIESELIHGYLLQDDGPFFPDPGEISEGRFWRIDEIESHLGVGNFTPNFEDEFKLLMRIVFKKEIQAKQ